MKETVYLDYNATVPVRPEVIETVTAIMGEAGNASSVHTAGRRARKHIEQAREQVAALAGVHANQLVFTSGATESNNAVLKHFAGRRILVSAVEHPAVRGAIPGLEYIPVTPDGLVDMAALETMLGDGAPPALVSVMLVNNETGVIQPVGDIARMVRVKYPDAFVHTDAVQAAGRIAIDFPALNVDYMSLSAHKCGGPQGVGALIVAPGAPEAKLLHGGGQEKRRRAGTENVAGIAGFGTAAALAQENIQSYQETLAPLRETLETTLRGVAPDLKIFGQNAPRVANTTALCLPCVPAQTQLLNLDLAGIAVSSGSACSSGTFKPSPVLQAMGASEEEASCTLRISSGWATTAHDIDRFLEVWSEIYKRTATKNLTSQPA